MCWRERRGCPTSLPHSPTASGDWVVWGDAGGGPGRGAFRRLGFEEEHDIFHDRLKRDLTSPTFHHDKFCRFIFSA